MKKRFYGVCALLCFCAAVACLALPRLSGAPFCTGVDSALGAPLRKALAAVSGLFPFSVGALLLLLLPFFAAGLAVFAVRSSASALSRRRFLALCAALFLFASSAQTFAIGFAYRAVPVSERLGWERRRADAASLSALCAALAGEVERLVPLLPAVLPEGREAIASCSAPLAAAFADLGLASPAAAKALYPASLYADLGLIGLYLPLTGEANVDPTLPPARIPSCVAHELGHGAGAAGEDDAGFLGFLACMRTGDPRIRFSACLDMLDAALEALALTDRAAFSAALAALPERAVAEREAYAAFCARRDGALLRASESISDRSLRAAGAGGLASYRALVCYAVGYNFS